MFVALKTLLHTLLLPPAGPLLVAFAGAWLIGRHSRARRLGWALLLLALGSLWLLSVPAFADCLQRLAEREPVLDVTHIPPAQAIVILGGSSERHAAPEFANQPATSGDLLGRLTYGAYLARRTALPVLVSGTLIEAQAMRITLERDLGVPVRWVEGDSRDTFENALFSARMLRAAGVSRILLVTQSTHEYRAVQEFEASGLSVIAAPTGTVGDDELRLLSFVPSPHALERSSAALYELIGDAVRRVFAALGLRRHAPLG